MFPVPLTVKCISLTETQGGPTNGEKVTGVVCPGLRSVERYTASNRERESTGVIDQNAGTANALDCEALLLAALLESVTF